ncbi:MAG TPA: 50S ribosomal protein L29 [Deltaproteobacteria bacterium]|nr:MAG: 50S ribosomal protein L29 [Deltaproteobacteria bacterium]RLB08443.1 MAG: 50S ribosomal protein L29 [Deltaproteobacteria bacterium]HDM76258.1 50S ribosomal protein L29 [Deltaproteobacteria bacterium]HEC32322.1 50S ribosomal protein L29 [Deltaproteobacteria bacterium]
MRASELRDMSLEELEAKLKEFSEALFNLKFQHATGQLDNTAQLKKTRRDIARVKTIINEKKRMAEAS